MIGKSLLVFALLVAAYMAVLPTLPPIQDGFTGGSQWDKNLMKEEELLYKKDASYEAILVGSSISARLIDLPESWFNLAMGGRSSIAGLNTLCNSSVDPCLVIVETNNLNLGASAQDNIVIEQLKKQHPAFLTENKPAHVLLRTLAKFAGMSPGGQRPTTNLIPSEPDKRTVSSELYSEMLERRLLICEKTMAQDELAERTSQIKEQVHQLEKRGFQFVFIEIPECEEAFDSPRKSQIRSAYRNMFPVNESRWFDDFENSKLYASNDAVHLTATSSKRFCIALVSYISKVPTD